MNLFEWGDISTGVYVALIIAGICMYVVILFSENSGSLVDSKIFLPSLYRWP